MLSRKLFKIIIRSLIMVTTKNVIPSYVLPVIVVAQFCCTSLWFASNGVMDNLIADFDLLPQALGGLTSAVQFGFIGGTLLFAWFSLADRFSPSLVFLFCAIAGGLANLGVIWSGHTFGSLLFLRFMTGFFLAGIYPIGMKISADYFAEKLGRSLGFLVGALVVGTAFPHLLKVMTSQSLSWRSVLITTSGLAIFGGLLMWLLIPDGPYRKAGQRLNGRAIFGVFRYPKFRAAAFGYFGHMWELYAFWAFVPVMLATYQDLHPSTNLEISWWSFLVISIGGLACILSGQLSLKFGAAKIARLALVLSGICCFLSPLFFYASFPIFILFLFFWGMVVIADSPLFSTLVANNAPPEIKGTALTLVNCLGFSITIVSIQLLTWMAGVWPGAWIYVILGAGPLLGLLQRDLK